MPTINHTRLLWILAVLLLCVLPATIYAKKQSLNPYKSISIRSMSTGTSLYAGNNITEMNWRIVEVMLPGYLNKKFPFGAIQLHHTNQQDQCLMDNGFGLGLGECASVYSGDYRTLFSLLPTSSGALQIQSIATENCIVVDIESTKKITQKLKTLPCFTAMRTPIDLHWIWILTPPYIDAKLSF